jgi:hypothetical protein
VVLGQLQHPPWSSPSPTAPTSPRSANTACNRLNAIIGAYEAFLDQVRGTDDLSFHLVLDLLAAETHQRADLQAALAQRN